MSFHPLCRVLGPALLLAAPFVFAGCGEDAPTDGVSRIFGQVVEQGNGIPIFGVGVSVEYPFSVNNNNVRGGVQTAAQPVVTPLVFPNPVAVGLVSGDVTIRLSGTGGIPTRVEIYREVVGFLELADTPFEGSVDGQVDVAWDARSQDGFLLPNGVYQVRVVAPVGDETEPEVATTNVVINRPSNLIRSQGEEAANTISDPDGFYLISDVGVGRRFTVTNGSGTIQGEGTLDNQVFLHFTDPDYAPLSKLVVLGPGDEVEVLPTALQRLATAVAEPAS